MLEQLQCYYWRYGSPAGNLGDALVPVLLAKLGYGIAAPGNKAVPVVNSGRCLTVIGSLLEPQHLSHIAGVYQSTSLPDPIDVWGCGWKGVVLPPEELRRLRIYAVRGPHTAAALGLPANTPLGDPALLLPYLALGVPPTHGRTLVVPHWHRRNLMPAPQRCRLAGCDELVSTYVIQRHAVWQRSSLRTGLGLVKRWLLLGIPPATPLAAVKRIAGAAFVLTGSLHGAILAQAYGVPWAAYDDGYVDAPAKWLDWAAYLGVRIEFVTSLAEGRAWWQAEGRRGALRDLSPLIESFPYGLSPLVRGKFALAPH